MSVPSAPCATTPRSSGGSASTQAAVWPSTAPRSSKKSGWTASTLLATSDPDITAEDTALGYKNLLEAERGFRDFKSELLLRPVFHRLEHRIRRPRPDLLARTATHPCRRAGEWCANVI